MTKTFIASLFAAALFSSTAAMANTSADTAPDRLPAASPSTSARMLPSAAESAALASTVWEGGQSGMQVRPTKAMQPMARTVATPSASLMAGAPYQFGAAN
jgi:hypothetical protein